MGRLGRKWPANLVEKHEAKGLSENWLYARKRVKFDLRTVIQNSNVATTHNSGFVEILRK